MDLAGGQKTDMQQQTKPEEKRIPHQLLESCTTEEVCEALGGNDKLLAELRNKLRDWLALQPHLPQATEYRAHHYAARKSRTIGWELHQWNFDSLRTNYSVLNKVSGDVPDIRLEYFLISTKLSLEQAKQKLDMHYTVRRLVPELFADRDPSGLGITQLRQTLLWVCLPKLTPDKHRVSILKCIDGDISKFQPWTFFKYTFMVGEVRISECRSLGDIYIYDLEGMRLGHLAKLTPTILKKCELAATKAYGARIKGIHFVNAPGFIDRIVALVKSAIKPKLAARIHVHSSKFDSVYEYIPKSILPVDYGGDQPTMNQLSEIWRQKFDEWRDWFLAQHNVTVVENLRPGSSVDIDEVFGFSGSFRKLEVD